MGRGLHERPAARGGPATLLPSAARQEARRRAHAAQTSELRGASAQRGRPPSPFVSLLLDFRSRIDNLFYGVYAIFLDFSFQNFVHVRAFTHYIWFFSKLNVISLSFSGNRNEYDLFCLIICDKHCKYNTNNRCSFFIIIRSGICCITISATIFLDQNMI